MFQTREKEAQAQKPKTPGKGDSFDDVIIHYRSLKPAQLKASAFTQGNRIYLGPGQEKYLSHELGHVIQQKEGRVSPSAAYRSEAFHANINCSASLEREADRLGRDAMKVFPANCRRESYSDADGGTLPPSSVIQMGGGLLESLIEEYHLDEEKATAYWPYVKDELNAVQILFHLCSGRSCEETVKLLDYAKRGNMDIEVAVVLSQTRFTTDEIIAFLSHELHPTADQLSEICRFQADEILSLFDVTKSVDYVVDLAQQIFRPASEILELLQISDERPSIDDFIVLKAWPVSDIQALYPFAKSWGNLVRLKQSRYQLAEIVSLAQCTPAPDVDTILSINRFTVPEMISLQKEAKNWELVRSASTLTRSVEDFQWIFKHLHMMNNDRLTFLEPFSIKYIKLMCHFSKTWDELYSLASSRYTESDLMKLYSSKIKPTVQQLLNIKYFTVDDMIRLLSMPDPPTFEQLAALEPFSASEIIANLRIQRGRLAQPAFVELEQLAPMASKVKAAQTAINWVRSFMPYGPGNQSWSWDAGGDRGFVRMSAHFELVDALRSNIPEYSNIYGKPRRLAAVVERSGGGNCQDIAALTYSYLRDNSQEGWTICYVTSPGAHHVFATIGEPGVDPPSTIIAVDAWVEHPRPITLDRHFCGKGKLDVIKKKGKRKTARTTLLSSKYPPLLPYSPDNLERSYRSRYRIYTKSELLAMKYLWGNATPDPT